MKIKRILLSVFMALLLCCTFVIGACSDKETETPSAGADDPVIETPTDDGGSGTSSDDDGTGGGQADTGTDDGDEETVNRVRVYDIPEGVDTYEGAEVYIDGQLIPVYSVLVNTSQSWTNIETSYQRVSNGVCLLELDGTVTVTVKPNTQINYSSVIRPASAKITPIANIADNELTFTFSSAGEYVLEVNGDEYDAIHFFISDYDDSNGAEDLEGYEDYENVIIFEAGLHTAETSEYIADDNTVTLTSNTLVYLEDGAVVRAQFNATDAENVTIAGRGVMEGSVFNRQEKKFTPMNFTRCTNVTVQQVSVLDPAGGGISISWTTDSKIVDVKIITSRSNGDGIRVQSDQNILIEGCFIRTWDDTVVVKNFARTDSETREITWGTTDNIVVQNCTLWTDLAQTMELGYETLGENFGNVTFDNITVLHAKHNAVISIHNANQAEIKDIKFTNITIEEAETPSSSIGIIDFQVLYSSNWSEDQGYTTALGNVDGVLVENVKVTTAKKFSMTISGTYDTRSGYEGEKWVRNVTIKNISLAGVVLSEEDCSINRGNYVENLQVYSEEGAEVTGATFISSRTAEYLAQFGSKTELIIVSN